MTKSGWAGFLLSVVFLLSACGEPPRPTPDYAIPTAPPTPANYEGVPAAATAGPVSRPTPQKASPRPGDQSLPTDTPLTPTVSGDSGDEPDGSSGGPGARLIDGTDPTVLARLYGTPGSGALPGQGGLALSPGVRRSGQPSRPLPTPTLNTNPQAVRIESLRTSQASFLFSYKQAAIKILEVSRTARPVFASANVLKPDRTTWSFLFVAPEGPRMWRVIFDTEGNRLDLREVAPAMVSDASLIDMSKVLDSSVLLERATAAGLNTALPVDIVNFQLEGQTKQPCFIFTNVAQGKQVALQAYTGQILRNDFVTG